MYNPRPKEYERTLAAFNFYIVHTMVHDPSYKKIAPGWLRSLSDAMLLVDNLFDAKPGDEIAAVMAAITVANEDAEDLTSAIMKEQLTSDNKPGPRFIHGHNLLKDPLCATVPRSIIRGLSLAYKLKQKNLKLQKVGSKKRQRDDDGEA